MEESAYFKRDSFRPITRLAKYQDPAVLGTISQETKGPYNLLKNLRKSEIAAEKIAAQKNQRNRSQSLYDKKQRYYWNAFFCYFLLDWEFRRNVAK